MKSLKPRDTRGHSQISLRGLNYRKRDRTYFVLPEQTRVPPAGPQVDKYFL